ncbi:MAG: hypothetical protein ACXV3C_09125, partial [Actinomycetes bacterium]
MDARCLGAAAAPGRATRSGRRGHDGRRGDVPGPAEADAALAGGALPEWLRTVGWAIAVIPVAATVGTFGELSRQAF